MTQLRGPGDSDSTNEFPGDRKRLDFITFGKRELPLIDTCCFSLTYCHVGKKPKA